ncbi:hypothetical protein EIP91_006337 [Steccherinum ochraceum]|uniref:Peptidase A1 domain-containing protein n=1 Tax=Steccherinum ochraceum TaxID=92696 RepID=A0A4R0R8E5_9APHY|nr:hypothetical protein EIP91_006337 [Steccherinum ochraceum]
MGRVSRCLRGRHRWAAIDTGTTGIGGPADVLDDLYAAVPGATAGSGQFQGFYIYPCSTDVTVSMRFGSSQNNWTISSADFKFQQIDNTNCVGALFQIAGGQNTPAWIVGDTFLKNVYSVYRSSPGSVGFANLSSTALAMNGVNAAAPSPTSASNAPGATASGGSSPNSSAALPSSRTSLGARGLAVCAGVVVAAMVWVL